MRITQTTTWEGTPAAIEAVVARSQEAAPIHEGLRAKSPRLMRSVSGGDVHKVEYMIDFDSFEAQGKFSDAIVDRERWTGIMQAVAAAYPDLLNGGTRLTYNAI